MTSHRQGYPALLEGRSLSVASSVPPRVAWHLNDFIRFSSLFFGLPFNRANLLGRRTNPRNDVVGRQFASIGGEDFRTLKPVACSNIQSRNVFMHVPSSIR